MKNEIPYLLTESILPEEILKERVDRQDIEKCTDGFLLMRLRGTQISVKKDEIIIHGWMVNIVSSGSVIVRLPLLLKVVVDADRKIKQTAILNEFKGSQGILCSKNYLKKRVDQKLVGTDFKSFNQLIIKESNSECLHIHEILMGAIAFYDHCLQNGIKEAYESENCYFYSNEEDIVALERHKSNAFQEICTKVSFPDAVRYMKFDREFNLYLNEEQEMICSEENAVEESKKYVFRKSLVAQKEMLKNFILVYRDFGKRIGCIGNYSFTCLYPKTIIGMLTEAIALRLYSNNYIYFQKCLLNMQRKDGKPKCIGAVENFQEAAEFYQMEMSDLEV